MQQKNWERNEKLRGKFSIFLNLFIDKAPLIDPTPLNTVALVSVR